MAYTTKSAPIKTGRGTEYEAFQQITHRLKTANPKQKYAAFVQTLHDNRTLWNLLAVDVADGGNDLPQKLRAQVFYLAEFTSHQTSKILASGISHDVLIEINTAVMNGLRQRQVVS